MLALVKILDGSGMSRLRWLLFIGLITINAVFSFSVNGGRITNKFGGVKVHIIHSSEENIEEFMRIEQSEIRIDDRGSDLTDRFKYKVRKSRPTCRLKCESSMQN